MHFGMFMAQSLGFCCYRFGHGNLISKPKGKHLFPSSSPPPRLTFHLQLLVSTGSIIHTLYFNFILQMWILDFKVLMGHIPQLTRA